MFVIRTRGVVAATLGVLGLGACAEPDQNTNLRPEGPPDVLAVLVMADAATHLYESATYCRPNDDKRPGLVGLPDFTTQQVCPETLSEGAEEVTNAYPDGWYVRIMFDELLDPNIEELVEVIDESTGEGTDTFTGTIANTRPVLLQCESATTGQLVNVAYDGYYSPSGNRITWPLGPSLVIKPNDPTLIATNTQCQITINDNVTDKSGTVVPADQRGPYRFSVAPIQVILIDPPDDPDFESPIFARQLWFDNPYIQFNTAVDLDSLCPDAGGDGLCDNESVFSFKDIEHPNEGPGYCNSTFQPCGKESDCTDAADTVCGRGFCTDKDDQVNHGSFTPCNTVADCTAPDDSCDTTYAYSYKPFGLTDTEFGIGPPEPLEVNRKYSMQFTQGAKLKDRCGKETTLGAPNADDLTLVRFITDAFEYATASIVTGETASANKRLQFNFSNVLDGHDTASSTSPRPAKPSIIDVASGEFTLSPMPKKLTGACAAAGAGCPTADLTPAELLIIPIDASGQISVQGHYQLNTEYTATIKGGTVIEDFYGKTTTVDAADKVIKWKTQPAIQMTGIAVRNTGELVSVGDLGTLTRSVAMQTTDVRLAFNASMDPTTLDLADVTVENTTTGGAVPTLALATASGCAIASNLTGWQATCTLRLRGFFAAGTYKITLKQGAQFKDMFGVSYTQEKDQSITVTIAEPPPAIQCL